MEKKYREFENYDFESQESYRQYIDGVYPAPTRDTLRRYKKKYYRKYVDPQFNVDFELASPAPGFPQYEVSWALNFRMMMFAMFICILPLGIVLRSYYHTLVLFFALLIGLLRKHGVPSMRKEYWRSFFLDEDFNEVISSAICLMNYDATMALWVPLGLFSVVQVADRVEGMSRRGNKIARILSSLLFKPVVTHREDILAFKADLEIYIGFYILCILPMGWVSLLFPLFYWQIMQVRYVLNSRTNAAFDKMGGQMDAMLASERCPLPVKWALRGMKKVAEVAGRMCQPQPPQPAADQQTEQKQEEKKEPEGKAEEEAKKEEEKKKEVEKKEEETTKKSEKEEEHPKSE